jgi:hypothetical protein
MSSMPINQRGPIGGCVGCSAPIRFVGGAARCIDWRCEWYWKPQGGISRLVPLDPPIQGPVGESVVLEPDTLEEGEVT